MRRYLLLALLVAGVTLLHLWLAAVALPARLGTGAAERSPRRIEVAFVHALAPTAPPAAAPAAPRPPPRRASRRAWRRMAADIPAPAASAAQADAPLVAEPAASAPTFAALDALPPLAALPASSPAARHFDWPPSTRLTYRLTGNYRGPVEGQSSVEWRRSGDRYQVFMDLSIGPPFAPLITRHVASNGTITPDGLVPLRYDEDTRVVFHTPRHITVWLDPERIRLADGSSVARPAGVQDSASQFVQLTWLFTTRPELLQPGQTIVLPLALARQVEPWTYDVLADETIYTPAGPVQAVHVKPRRPPHAGHELSAEIWVAPSLEYLPVRILIRQDEQTFVDLNIDKLPEQAAPGH